MKKLSLLLALIVLVALPVAFACDKDKPAATTAEFGKGPVKEVVLTGFLTDSNCGANNANAKNTACALHCIKSGAKVQLMADQKLYTLEKLDRPEDHLGHEVRVTGLLDEASNVIRVASIEAVRKS